MSSNTALIILGENINQMAQDAGVYAYPGYEIPTSQNTTRVPDVELSALNGYIKELLKETNLPAKVTKGFGIATTGLDLYISYEKYVDQYGKNQAFFCATIGTIGGVLVGIIISGIPYGAYTAPFVAALVSGYISSQYIELWSDLQEKTGIYSYNYKERIPEIIKEFFDKGGNQKAKGTDPIIFDLNRDGILETTSMNNGKYFDFANDGFAELTSWVANEDGILVVDSNNNSSIDNISEILTHEILSLYDSNANGIIDSNDTNFSDLKILKGDGSLLSLNEANISSINLSVNTTNITDENENYQFAQGSYTGTDGVIGEYGEFLLNSDTSQSIATTWLEETEEIAELPDIDGCGTVYSLHQAMLRNSQLQSLVDSFATETNDETRMNLLEQILLKWTGADSVETNARGENINAQHLVVMEKFFGSSFWSTYEENNGNENPSNPNLSAGKILETGYEKLKLNIYADLMAQTHLKDLLENIVVEFDLENGFTFDLTDVISALQSEMETNTESARQKVFEFAKFLKGFGYDTKSNFFDPKDDSCFYTTFTKDDRELKWLIDTIGKVPFEDEIGDGEGSAADDSYRLEEQGHFHSLSGDDVAYGSDDEDSFSMCSGDDLVDAGNGNDIIDTHGGNDIVYAGAGNDIIHASDGNDIIYGGDGDDTIYPDNNDDFSWSEFGNDTIIGGKGNDTIISMTGDDTFIFNIGDGQDTIIEHQGVDTLYFGPNITWEDLTFTQSENDMVISINDTTDSITVKDWFAADEDGVYRYNNHKIEIFEFADGSKHYKDEITVGNNTESITYNMSELEEHIDLASNYKTTVNIKDGRNDIVAGENSDDTYVLSQEFSDVLIQDYSGNNKIVFDNENITLANTFFAYNEDGLEVWFDCFDAHLQINGNNFSFEFSDNTIITDISQYLTRDVSYTDYIMGDNLPELALLGYDSVTVNDSNIDSHITLNYGDTTVDFGQNYTHIDSLYGGNDTYIYNIGDGNKYIVDLGGNDTIQFGVGITQENIRFLKDLQNNNLEIWFDIESDVDNSLTIENFFNNDNKIENFVFSDGSTITDVTPYINAYGSQHYSDLILPDNIQEAHLRGEGHTTAIGNDYDNHFNGNEGDNTFIGGQGNDSFHDDCETSERYIYNLGDGNDFIYDYGGVDAIIFGEGITKENIKLAA